MDGTHGAKMRLAKAICDSFNVRLDAGKQRKGVKKILLFTHEISFSCGLSSHYISSLSSHLDILKLSTRSVDFKKFSRAAKCPARCARNLHTPMEADYEATKIPKKMHSQHLPIVATELGAEQISGHQATECQASLVIT